MPTLTPEQASKRQADQIAYARRLLNPQEVEQGIPGWFSKRLRAFCKARNPGAYLGCSETNLHHAISAAAADIGVDSSRVVHILDHWGTIKGGPYECCHRVKSSFVSEPYDFGGTAARVLDGLCETLNLQWHISPNSWHYPGRTIRIIIHEKVR